MRARLFHLGFGLAYGGIGDAEIDDRLLLAVLGQFVVLFRIVAHGLCGDLGEEHLARPIHVALKERNVRPRGLHFGAFVFGLGGFQRRLRHAERRLRLADPWQQVVLVEFTDHLALVYAIAYIHREFQDDAGRFGFDLDFGGWLDLPGGDYGAGQVDALNLDELLRIDLGGRSA